MEFDYGDFRLKEAAVVLTKLDDDTVFQSSHNPITRTLNVSAMNSSSSDGMGGHEVESVSQTPTTKENRKRKRKNTVPQRKIIRTAENYDEDEESFSLMWTDNELENTDDELSFPYLSKTSVIDYDVNMSAFEHDDFKQDAEHKLLFSKTPMFMKKNKEETISKIPQKPIVAWSDVSNEGNETIDPSLTTVLPRMADSHTKVYYEESKRNKLDKIYKQKEERTMPNILSHRRRLPTSSTNSTVTSPQYPISPVEIRPNPQKTSALTKAARNAFEDTLNKQTPFLNKTVITNSLFPEIKNNGKDKQEMNKTSIRDSSNIYAAQMSTKLHESNSVNTSSTLYTHEPEVMMSSYSQFTPPCSLSFEVLSPFSMPSQCQYAASCSGSTSVTPPISRPRYSSRLRSKSGTKYIVRKDSIITADLVDIFKPVFSAWPEPAPKLVLKVPDQYLNEKQFYNNFVKKTNSLDADNTQHGKNPQCSENKSPVPIRSAELEPYVSRTSPILRLTHFNSDKKSTEKEKPIRLVSRGGLEDIKREMNTVNPNTWNLEDTDKQTMPELVPVTPDRIKNCPQVSTETSSPTGRFLANLQERLLPCNDSRKKGANAKHRFINEVLKKEKAQILLDDHNFIMEGNKMKKCQKSFSAENKDTADKNIEVKNKFTNNTRPHVQQSNLVKHGNKSPSKSAEIDRCIPTEACIEGGSFSDCHIKQKLLVQYQGAKGKCPDLGLVQTNERVKQQPTESVKICQVKLEPTHSFIENVSQIKREPTDSCKSNTSQTKQDNMKSNPVSQCKVHVKKEQFETTQSIISPSQIKEEPEDNTAQNIHEGKDLAIKSESKIIVIKQKQTLNDHAYTRPEKVLAEAPENQKEFNSLQSIPTVVKEFQANKLNTIVPSESQNLSPSKIPPIPVYAVRCGEKVVLFPASQAVSLEKVTAIDVMANNTPKKAKSPKKMTPSKSLKKVSVKKNLLYQPEKDQMNFAKKFQLKFAFASKHKKSEQDVNDLVTTDFKTVVSKRPRNQMKHMCAVAVQITRSDDDKYSFSKGVLALSFTNGSNPVLVRWHKDGIHLAMVTFNSQGRIQHLTVDTLTPGFYSLHLKNNRCVRKSRTFEGLLTSTLPNEDLLRSDNDFIAIGQIKNIMDPTLSRPDIKMKPGLTLTEALADVLPLSLMQVYNPTISDRSYRPKIDDKNWYTKEKFETFTKTYGRTRSFQPNGCRLPGEEVR